MAKRTSRGGFLNKSDTIDCGLKWYNRLWLNDIIVWNLGMVRSFVTCNDAIIWNLGFRRSYNFGYSYFRQCLAGLREGTPYHFACSFIKFINGLWPPPRSFYKVTMWIFWNIFTTFFSIEYDSLISKTDFTSLKRLKISFFICLRRPFLCQFHVAKALQNI